MAGRKRKFPAEYVVPENIAPEEDDDDPDEAAEPNETHEQHDGQQEDLGEPIQVDHHDAQEEHGAGNEEVPDENDISGEEAEGIQDLGAGGGLDDGGLDDGGLDDGGHNLDYGNYLKWSFCVFFNCLLFVFFFENFFLLSRKPLFVMPS